jgi:signal transduction histidine kinase
MSAIDAATAARMRSLARLARPTAHELRGASNTLAIHLELLAGALEESPDADARRRSARYLAVLREENRRLLGMANAFLEIAALPGGPPGEVDLAALVSSVVRAVRPLATERRVQLESTDVAPIRRLVPDQEGCRQRLLDAALDALGEAPPGATVQVGLCPDGVHASVSVEGGAAAETLVPLAPAPEQIGA